MKPSTSASSRKDDALDMAERLVTSFSQQFAYSQYSRNLHKIFIQTGLCKMNRILSSRGHRKAPFYDEKEG